MADSRVQGAMLLSPRARRGFDMDSASHAEHEHSNRQRSQLLSPRPNPANTANRHAHHGFFLSNSPPPSSWHRRQWPSSIVPILATACLCTILFCVMHLYLTDATATPAVQPYPQQMQHSSPQSTTVQPELAARQQHILAVVESCLRRHPSYSDPTDQSLLARPHTRLARPFPPLPADCIANLSLSVHEQSVVQLRQLVHRMHASDDELDFFDPLSDRLAVQNGLGVPYAPLPSTWLHWAEWDGGLDELGHDGGDCELIEFGQGRHAHRQEMYAIIDATAAVDPKNKHQTSVTTTSLHANTTSIKICSPTSGQPGQEQDIINVTTAAKLPPTNSSYLPRPPLTYLLSRHNSANPWHTLIEHIYPQWLQMFLRGDFPHTFDQLTEAFSGPASSPPFSQPHFDVFVYHETGSPNGPVFDGWWRKLLGVPVRYLRAGDSVSCSLCIFGPPKALTVYDYWGGSRFVYDSATQALVRLFRRHVYARVDVAPWRGRADDTPSVTYSFQRSVTTYWRPRGGGDNRQRLPVEYVLPDFPKLLESERRALSNQRGRNVTMAELSPSGFNFTRLASPSRSILISGNGTWTGWPGHGSQRHTALSSLPLVVLTRRGINNARTLRPFTTFTSFYQQPAIRDTLPYHLLLVYIEDLPLADQVALLSTASVLLTVEGASEINQLYLPLRSVVIEVECDRRFYDGSRPRPWHQSLGQYLSHLFVQWSVDGCDSWDDEKAQRLHELLVRVLSSTERDKYVYMS